MLLHMRMLCIRRRKMAWNQYIFFFKFHGFVIIGNFFTTIFSLKPIDWYKPFDDVYTHILHICAEIRPHHVSLSFCSGAGSCNCVICHVASFEFCKNLAKNLHFNLNTEENGILFFVQCLFGWCTDCSVRTIFLFPTLQTEHYHHHVTEYWALPSPCDRILSIAITMWQNTQHCHHQSTEYWALPSPCDRILSIAITMWQNTEHCHHHVTEYVSRSLWSLRGWWCNR